MVSPIRCVMVNIHETLVKIAPERQAEFEKEFANCSLEYLDSGEFICDVNVASHHIRLSRQVVELLWSISFGYMTFYTKVVQVHKQTTRQTYDLTQDTEVARAMKLLKWAYGNWLLPTQQIPWPDVLPRPVEHPESGTMENLADELCLSAVAALLHHELAHIRLNHHAPTSIDEEREADHAMADWILNNNLSLTEARFIKRALGIAVAMEILIANGIYTGNFGGGTHPRSYDRLINTISPYLTHPNHIVWHVLVHTLNLHLGNRGIATPDVAYESYKECVNAYIDLLSTLSQ